MGYIEIPKINVHLPIYHGTGDSSLSKVVGHLLGSSLPVGGESTHAILSGHSGMASQTMFTDLEQLGIGDVFYLYVLDDVLAYQVTEINTVLPSDTSLLGIWEGEDYCTLPSGETLEQTCRYIDETHLEVGNNLYHICEFAERMHHNGVKTIPLRSSLPDKCFSVLESTGEMIVITKGEKGYAPTGIYPQSDSPKEGASALNATNGVTKAQEAAMVAGSMFGWETPAADPKNYDDQVIPIRAKAKDRDER